MAWFVMIGVFTGWIYSLFINYGLTTRSCILIGIFGSLVGGLLFAFLELFELYSMAFLTSIFIIATFHIFLQGEEQSDEPSVEG